MTKKTDISFCLLLSANLTNILSKYDNGTLIITQIIHKILLHKENYTGGGGIPW
jgi:hypothetical protein